MTIQFFDHYSNQEHESVTSFLSKWGENPWDDANVPISLYLGENEDGIRSADVVVYHPRKDHIKHVVIIIKNDDELGAFRKTFLGIGERIFDQAAYNLEAFAKGAMPKRDILEEEWGGYVLYYWERDEFVAAT